VRSSDEALVSPGRPLLFNNVLELEGGRLEVVDWMRSTERGQQDASYFILAASSLARYLADYGRLSPKPQPPPPSRQI